MRRRVLLGLVSLVAAAAPAQGAAPSAAPGLFVVSARGPLRVLACIGLPGQDVCRLAWPTPRRLLAVVTRGPACYTPIDGARLLVVDPLGGRIVAARRISGPATIVAAARTPGGLALLVEGRATPELRLLVVGANRTRSIGVGRAAPSTSPLDKSVGSTIGLAVDPAGRHAYVVRPDGSITDVAVDTGAVTVHASRARTPSAVEKGIAAAEVQALSVAPGVLVYSGIRRSAGGRLVPIGVRLVDTRTWRDRLLIAHASGFAYADGTILAYQPFVDQLGRAIPRTGVHVYTAAGRLRLRTFSDEQVELVRVQGRYAYLAGPGGTSVLDLRSGALSVAVTDASLSFELLAGPGSLTAAGG